MPPGTRTCKGVYRNYLLIWLFKGWLQQGLEAIRAEILSEVSPRAAASFRALIHHVIPKSGQRKLEHGNLGGQEADHVGVHCVWGHGALLALLALLAHQAQEKRRISRY